MSDLASLEQRARAELASCRDEADLRAWNTKYFGKQGEMTLALRKVGEIAPGERKAYGQEANRIKEALESERERALARQKEKQLEQSLAAQALDVTLPGRPVNRGRLHPATQ